LSWLLDVTIPHEDGDALFFFMESNHEISNQATKGYEIFEQIRT
jgi:hypothetical protein